MVRSKWDFILFKQQVDRTHAGDECVCNWSDGKIKCNGKTIRRVHSRTNTFL